MVAMFRQARTILAKLESRPCRDETGRLSCKGDLQGESVLLSCPQQLHMVEPLIPARERLGSDGVRWRVDHQVRPPARLLGAFRGSWTLQLRLGQGTKFAVATLHFLAHPPRPFPGIGARLLVFRDKRRAQHKPRALWVGHRVEKPLGQFVDLARRNPMARSCSRRARAKSSAFSASTGWTTSLGGKSVSSALGST